MTGEMLFLFEYEFSDTRLARRTLQIRMQFLHFPVTFNYPLYIAKL
jgi:hypothetical protein